MFNSQRLKSRLRRLYGRRWREFFDPPPKIVRQDPVEVNKICEQRRTSTECNGEA